VYEHYEGAAILLRLTELSFDQLGDVRHHLFIWSGLPVTPAEMQVNFVAARPAILCPIARAFLKHFSHGGPPFRSLPFSGKRPGLERAYLLFAFSPNSTKRRTASARPISGSFSSNYPFVDKLELSSAENRFECFFPADTSRLRRPFLLRFWRL
jgi:hypothetical protein